MAIPFLQVQPRSMKLKVSPRFPAQLIGGAGIDVVKANGNYTLDLDYTDFPQIAVLPTDATYALIFDPVTGTYVQAPISLLAGGIPEAPIDGQLYGRKSAAWSVVPSGPPPSPNIPIMDGTGASGAATPYAREDHVHPSDTSRAPLASPALTGAPTAPTPTVGDNTTKIATTAFVLANSGGGGGGVPSGTVMLFWQAAAPTGWTQVTTHNDKALRVVSGSGGVAGGTNSFSSVMAQTVVGNHTLTNAEIASHAHVMGLSDSGYASPTTTASSPSTRMEVASNAGSGYVTNGQGGGGAHNHPITMSIQYIDVILASKN
jgi:hypothetical protein